MSKKAMATEWGPDNNVNAIGPGYFLTDLTKPLQEHPESQLLVSARPPGPLGPPEELVGVAVFLASEAANYVNGRRVAGEFVE
ncbi:MAG: SDR family oxidoreductase [Firmicutes bacterium]|nr:SDR family oxidoreductase [Bacillota bacterium]